MYVLVLFLDFKLEMYNNGIIVGFSIMFIWAFGLKIVAYFYYRRQKKDFMFKSHVPVCQNKECKKLESKMISLMKKRLDFEEDSVELEEVKTALNCILP